MTAEELPYRLPCGEPVDAIVDQIARGDAAALTTHERGCEYCRRALAELGARWRSVVELATAPVAPPRDLVDAVLRRVRGFTGRGRDDAWHAELADDADHRGLTTVRGRVLSKIARRAAARVPGVVFAFATTDRADPSLEAAAPTSAQGDPVAGVLRVSVAAAYDLPIPPLAAAVRAAVVAELANLTGLPAVRVDVRVDDAVLPT